MLSELEQKYIKRSTEVLAKAKATYQKQLEILNDNALSKYEQQLIEATTKELQKLKEEYIKEANKVILDKEKELNTPVTKGTVEEQILEQLQIQNNIKDYEMKYNLVNVDTIIGTLQQQLIETELEFIVAKNSAYNRADPSQRQQLVTLNYMDKDRHLIEVAKADVKRLEINRTQYMTGLITDIRGYVTEKSVSDTFFS